MKFQFRGCNPNIEAQKPFRPLLSCSEYIYLYVFFNSKMQISLATTIPKVPSFSTFYPSTLNQTQYNVQKPSHGISKQTHISLPAPCAFKSSSTGFLSAIERAIEEEEYRKARAEVIRKGLNVEGYSIEGHSIGGHETCVIVPQLKAAFDIGRCPSRAVHQNFLFITHAHLDHIVSFSSVNSML